MTRPRPTLLRGAIAALVLMFTAALAIPTTSSAMPTLERSGVAAAPAPPGALVVIGTGGLTWTDVSQTGTPNLWSLLRDGSSAAMTIRSVFTNTCPVDGWLGLGAGGRAAGPSANGDQSRSTAEPCQPLPTPTNGAIPGWATYQQMAAAQRFDTQLGLLGSEAQAAGECIQAIGPGAALAAATKDGKVATYAPYAASALTELLATCPIALVDVGSLRNPDDIAAGEPAAQPLAAQLKALDHAIGEVISAAPNGANIILGSLSDAGQTERLRLAAAKGPLFGPGTLESPSTRQPGLIQMQDLTVTALSLAGLPVPQSLGGAVLSRDPAENNSIDGANGRLRDLIDYDEASHEVHSLVPPFFNGVVGAQLIIYLLVALLWKGKIGSDATRMRSLRLTRHIAVVAAAVPAATFLANLLPWWRFPSPMVGVVAAVALFVALISAVALLGPWGRTFFGPMVIVCAATMLVLGVDVMTGSRLQLSSLMGLQPVIGGRYYGLGNVEFALFATSALLLATVVANHFWTRQRPRVAAASVLFIGGVATVIDGAPFWGADGGGPLALIPATAYLALTLWGIKLTWKRGILLGLGTAAMFLTVCFVDWLRPDASRSHLGRFFQSILDGGALDIMIRKAEQNFSILTSNYPLTFLVPIALLFVIYVMARPTSWGSTGLQKSFDRAPVLRWGLIAVLALLTIGFLTNDSGVAIPAVGATIAVPFIIATAVQVLREESAQTASSRSARRGR